MFRGRSLQYKTGYEYYEYRIDDIAYEIQTEGTDFYGFDEIIKSVLEKNQWLKSSVAAEVAPYVEGTPYKKGGQGGWISITLLNHLRNKLVRALFKSIGLKRRITLGMTANRLMTLVSGFPVK